MTRLHEERIDCWAKQAIAFRVMLNDILAMKVMRSKFDLTVKNITFNITTGAGFMSATMNGGDLIVLQMGGRELTVYDHKPPSKKIIYSYPDPIITDAIVEDVLKLLSN